MMSLIDHFFPTPPPPFVRSAACRDAPDLATLHAACFARGWEVEEFERLIADGAVRAHVATAGGRGPLLGFVLSSIVVPESEILSVAVTAEARGRGIGRSLLVHHLSRLAAEGVTTSFLEVEEGNAPALALYRRLGYAEVGRRKGYYAGIDALLLRRDF